MSNPNPDNQPQPIANDSPNLNNANTYGTQSTDSAYSDRTQTMGTSRTDNPANRANQATQEISPEQQTSQDNWFTPANGNIGVGSPASDTGTPVRDTADSDVIPNAKRAGSVAPTPPGEEQGIRGTDRPNPPITDVREQANPSQP